MSTTANPPAIEREWLPRCHAMRRLNVGNRAFANIVASGSITVRRLPGAPPRYHKPSIDALLAASTRPAVPA